jgi:hypothetical protein
MRDVPTAARILALVKRQVSMNMKINHKEADMPSKEFLPEVVISPRHVAR